MARLKAIESRSGFRYGGVSGNEAWRRTEGSIHEGWVECV